MFHRKEEFDELIGPLNLVVIVIPFHEDEKLEIKAPRFNTNLVAV